jgi:hypothetical protein
MVGWADEVVKVRGCKGIIAQMFWIGKGWESLKGIVARRGSPGWIEAVR